MKKEMLYEGKAKQVFATANPKEYIVYYKDDATAFNGEKKGSIMGKGAINNQMSDILFAELEKHGIPTHFLEKLSERETLVKAVEILPLEVIIRNIAAGSMAKKYGVQEGSELKKTVLEFCYKNDDLGDPLMNDDHVLAMGLADEEDIQTIKAYTHKINEVLREYFIKRDIILVDFKLEFGLYDGKIILADEISPDTCRFWDAKTMEKLDKDRFRRDLGNVEEGYQEMLKRVENSNLEA